MAEKISLEDLKQVVKDLAEQVSAAQQRMAEQVSEAQQRMAEQVSEAQQRTEVALKEVAEAQKETEKSLEKTQAAVKEQSKNLDRADGNFTRKWGAFMEKLVKGNLIDLLQKQRISVHAIMRKFEICENRGKDKLAEFDLLALNGDEMVVVEVKTTLSSDKLAKFIHNLKKYRHRLPLEKRTKVYGAVAYLDDDGNSKEEAIAAGLFVIEAPRQDGEFATIANPEGFEPRGF